MELIHVGTTTTGLQDLFFIIGLLSVIGFFVSLMCFVLILDDNSVWVVRHMIIMFVSLIILGSVITIPEWTPRYEYFYHVTDLEQLEGYTEEYKVYDDYNGLYKLVKK